MSDEKLDILIRKVERIEKLIEIIFHVEEIHTKWMVANTYMDDNGIYKTEFPEGYNPNDLIEI